MPEYSLPFNRDGIILEVGGGDRPSFRPNMDVRGLPNVDIVADLSKHWPIDGEIYDGVYGSYIIEHISWRNVWSFVAECHRVLKPGGKCVMITADLLEQARVLVNSPQWNNDLVCMVFGDNDYPENTHRCGFSPEFAVRMFVEAGFHEVIIRRHPGCATDMIIEATKSGAIIQKAGNSNG